MDESSISKHVDNMLIFLDEQSLDLNECSVQSQIVCDRPIDNLMYILNDPGLGSLELQPQLCLVLNCGRINE